MANTERSRDAGITAVIVGGYKSLAAETRIEVRPLTLLAGANSSGKSSMMQGLLLLKQTIEAPYDPGPLKIDGPNVNFTDTRQLLSTVPGHDPSKLLCIGIEKSHDNSVVGNYVRSPLGGFDLAQTDFSTKTRKVALRPGMGHDDIVSLLDMTKGPWGEFFKAGGRAVSSRERCFFYIGLQMPKASAPVGWSSPIPPVEPDIRSTIHVPGLRGNPRRTYPVVPIGTHFPGTFENYAASVIHHWQRSGDSRAQTLSRVAQELGLTWKIRAEPIDDTQVDIRVGRTVHARRGGARDMVSIADVGFGLSQVLPALVALIAAEPEQLVYIEQPEIHLHPRAQVALAGVLAEAANRGVRVVAETHSALLLQGIQNLVAKSTLPSEKVILHWFRRNEKDGMSEVISRDLDADGAFGDWPEDFADVSLNAEQEYLDTVTERHLGKAK